MHAQFDVRHFPQQIGSHLPKGTSRHLCNDQKEGRRTGSLNLASALFAPSFSPVRLVQVNSHQAACPQLGAIAHAAAHHDQHEAVPHQAGPQEADNVFVRATFQQRDLTGKTGLQPQASR